MRWHVSGSLFLPKRRLERQLRCSADCKKKTYWFACDRQSVRPIIFRVVYKWALILKTFPSKFHRRETWNVESAVLGCYACFHPNLLCFYSTLTQTSGKKNNNNFPSKNEKVTTPASFFKAPCSLDDSQLFLTDAEETVSYSWWQAQMSWDGSKSSPSSDQHTNVFCQFHNENSAQDAHLINICTYCSTIKYFSSLCTVLHATANVKVWNQTNEYCQAEKCGFRPDNGGKPGAVHRKIQSACQQIRVFSHKNLREKTLPRYVPYSSCKGVQMYEPSRDEGIKDIYYFYCSARFKNSSFSLQLQEISCQLFVCGARVCRVAQLCRAHLAITKQQRADITTTTTTTQRRLSGC